MRQTTLIMDFITEMAGEEAEVIMGMVYNPNMGDSLNVTVIATGFQDNSAHAKQNSSSSNVSTAVETGYTTQAKAPKEPEFIVTPVETLPSSEFIPLSNPRSLTIQYPQLRQTVILRRSRLVRSV